MSADRGYILWEGPSPIDGAPIALIATVKTTNRKTGNMVQTWILRTDMRPTDAIASGADASICGACPLRGDGSGAQRACYVNVGQAPQAVYRGYTRGIYPTVTPARAAELLRGRQIRMGAYGDPGMIPVGVWESLLRFTPPNMRSGYTHRKGLRSPRWMALVMASADTAAEALKLQERGWRTFRAGAERAPGEKPCPAGPKASTVQCTSCPLKCSGGTGASVFIEAHGSGATHHAAAVAA